MVVLQFWDSRKKIAIDTYQSNYQVTAVSFTDTAEQLISGGIDNEIKVRVLRAIQFDLDAVSLKFRSSFISTKYTSLGVNLPPNSFSETAPSSTCVMTWMENYHFRKHHSVKILYIL